MVPFESARRSAANLTRVARHFVEGDGHTATQAMLEQMAQVLAQV